MSEYPESLVLVGAGKMGGAMLEGWLKGGLSGAAVTVLDPHPSENMVAFARVNSIRLNPDLAMIGTPDVLVLAIKPQMLDAAAPVLTRLADHDTLVLSILAGKTIPNLADRMPATASFARAMPNTPAAVGRGITGVAFSSKVSSKQKQQTQTLLAAVGQVVLLDDEHLIDVVTAVSGSGPAYVFLLAECMAEAGVAAGLPNDVAMRLARATVEGAGELMFQEAETGPDQLRKNVTSPGGTTAAALDVLMAPDGLAPLMKRAIAAAKRRAGELSG